MNYSEIFYVGIAQDLDGSEYFFKQQVLGMLNNINSTVDFFTKNNSEKYLKHLLHEISLLEEDSNVAFTKGIEIVAKNELNRLQPGYDFLNKSFVIIGGVGTGKSTRLTNFAKILIQEEKSLVFLTQGPYESPARTKDSLITLAESTDYLLVDEAHLVLGEHLTKDFLNLLIQKTNLVLSVQSATQLPELDSMNFDYHIHLKNRDTIELRTVKTLNKR